MDFLRNHEATGSMNRKFEINHDLQPQARVRPATLHYLQNSKSNPSLDDLINQDVASTSKGDGRLSNEDLGLEWDSTPLPECFSAILQNESQPSFLASPEIDVLQLESPELEKLLSQAQHPEPDVPGLQSDHLHIKNGAMQERTNEHSSLPKREIDFPFHHQHVDTGLHSPNISEQDLQFITETNNALKAMMPAKQREAAAFEQRASPQPDFPVDLFEPLQCVPSSTPPPPESTVIPKHVDILDLLQCANNNYEEDKNTIYREIKSEEKYDPSQENPQNFYHVIEEHVANQKRAQAEREKNRSRALLDNYINSRDGLHGRDDVLLRTAVNQRYVSGDSKDMGLPPIDLEVQEIVKRERKKFKNRVAASKCRKKKLEREAQLEIRVNQLKEQNMKMSSVALALRQQVGELRQRVFEHMNAGCPITLIQQQQPTYYL